MKTRIFLSLAAALVAIIVFADTEKPVRIGILTDTHIGAKGCEARLEKAYGLFKRLSVDRIFNLGDICEKHDSGMFAKYVAVRTRVYGDKLPPETYVYANHDCAGKKFAGDDREHSQAFAKAKEALGILNERYDSFELAGCRFLVFPQYRDNRRIEKMLVQAADGGSRPIFILDHLPPAGTVDRSDTGGNPDSRKLYNRFPQVVTLSGHVHSSLVCEGNVWQGEFTAFGFGALKNTPDPQGRYVVAVLELTSRQAVVRRYELDSGAEIGAGCPWTIRFPYDRTANAPYAFATRSKAVGLPAFSPTAKVTVRASAKDDEIVVRYPFADRGWNYAVDALVEKDGAWKRRSMIPRLTGGEARFSAALFDPGETVRFTARPFGAFRDEGLSLSSDFRIAAATVWKTLYAGVPEPAKAGEWLDFKGGTWLKIPPSALAVPSGTPMRIVIDAETEIESTQSLSFNLRTDRSADYAFGYIYTPLGSSALRYAKTFKRPKRSDESYDLFLNSANWTPFAGRVKINWVKLECR